MLISPAYAQAAGGASAMGGSFGMILQLVLLGLVMWFFIFRPQQKRMKEHKAKIEAVKKGDQVVTGGGLVGKVVRVDEVYADIELAPGMKVKAVKSTLTDVIDPMVAKPAND